MLGLVELNEGKYEKAKTYFQIVLDLNPNDWFGVYNMTRAECLNNEYLAALENLECIFTNPSIFASYKESIVVTSYSKDLSIPGERIGFMAINPNATHKQEVFGGLALANRILGYVNAPALMQRIVGRLQGVSVNIDQYQKKRDMLCDGLAELGYKFIKPEGTFYLFPQSPIDDMEMVTALQDELILTVPGRGFGLPGYFRIAYCVGDEVIEKSMEGFARVAKKVL